MAQEVNGVYNARFRKEVREMMQGSKRSESYTALHASAGICLQMDKFTEVFAWTTD